MRDTLSHARTHSSSGGNNTGVTSVVDRMMTLGLFARYEDAARAIDDLLVAGFNFADISVASKENKEIRTLAEKGSDAPQERAGQGAGTGAVAGGLIGLVAGASAIAIPGLGPLLVAGPMAAGAAAGAGIGALTGGVIGYLSGLGLSREQAERYEKGMRAGDLLLSVSSPPEESDTAEQILKACGGREVRSVSYEDEGAGDARERGEVA